MGASLDFRDRDALFDALDGAAFDVVVIGGGVTGAGVARDAAMRGLKVALVEARDFASGTSSRSSKMIHGGLRYLAQGDLGLVREAASERKAVQRIAPHLARRTPFVIPARSGGAVAKLRAGLWAFEKLGGVPKGQSHEVWSKAELKAEEPAVNVDDLAGAVVYPEFLTDDAKLTLANVRSAQAHGAAIASYAPVVEILMQDGRAVGVRIEDALEPPSPLRGGGARRSARILAKVVINAAGPWVDALRGLESAHAAPRLKLTKGVHLVVPRARLPVTRTVIVTAPDKRSIFAVPKGEHSYIGTTDTFYDGEVYWPRVEAEDADYLLAAVATRFSTLPLTHGDVTSAWAGVRPLVAEEGKSESQISRRDEIWTGPGGVLSIAGGKLTAYRRMAERIIDMAEEALGRKPQASRSAVEPLVGGDVDLEAMKQLLLGSVVRDASPRSAPHHDEDFVQPTPPRHPEERPEGASRRTQGRYCRTPQEADRLIALYGSEAADLIGGPAVEARHAVLHEGALTLEDYWSRRSARACFDDDAGMAALAPAAREMAGLLGWSEAETWRQVEACKSINDHTMAALRPTAEGSNP